MSSINDGGPAFPVVHAIVPQPGHFTTTPEAQSGMSLRDYFAGQAIQGLLAYGHHQVLIEAGAPDYQRAINDIAEEGYQYADAMLAARTTTKGGE